VPAVAAPVPAVVILGTDAFLAARPATPVQLANACLAAGYSAAVPASWGDELVAAACVKRLASRGDEAVIVCSCPRVVERLRRVTSLRNNVLAFVPPPVAAARYLRARAATASGANIAITYIGDCPGAADPAIDRYATPQSLLRSLNRRGIKPIEQPTVMDERVARDGRRFYSLPGGAPAPNWVYAEGRGASVVEPESQDYLAEIANRVAKRDRAVIDLAPRLGCACSGAVPGLPWAEVRQYVSATEPARAVHEVMDHDFDVDVSLFLEPWAGSVNGAGVPTMAMPLAALAAQYVPDAKADPVRQAPPSPVPLPAPSALARRPQQSLPSAASTAPLKLGAITGSAWDGSERRKWDGIERRQGWVEGRPPGWIDGPTIPTTGSMAAVGPAEMGIRPNEPRTVPLRNPHTFIRVPSSTVDRRRMLGLTVICSAVVASLISVVTVKVYTLSERPAALTHVVAPVVAAPAPAPLPVVLPESTITPPLPSDAPPVDAPASVPAPPVAKPRRRRVAPPVAHNQPPEPPPVVSSTPAPTPTPVAQTAAPVAPTPTPTPIPIPAAAPPTPPDTGSAEMQAIRAEIEARRRRIDSLAHLVDSLRTRPAVPPPTPPGH
jgi:hypothetical protein